ncbi:uncharacterized protein N7483_005909 [Penicillium malachiteum]|uniref:uncharacterized protein n=1 Tax=Penicillium malachiteum TaxID=1324776 RepID=UPI002546922C|nr:uncharacterized protein N7483_005909 [Penicillium malachiteum]KAJ5731401.1 hypothetical protein N7483_005909 [Penicillium malachiteum]
MTESTSQVSARQLPALQIPPHPDFRRLIEILSQPLHPLRSCTSNQAPANFPKTLFAWQVLTHEQLDGLARFFHQTSPPTSETKNYPLPIDKPWVGPKADPSVTVETKRLRFGRFIGLKGCESPLEPHPLSDEPIAPLPALNNEKQDEFLSDLLGDVEGALEVEWEMECEWQAGLGQRQPEPGYVGMGMVKG